LKLNCYSRLNYKNYKNKKGFAHFSMNFEGEIRIQISQYQRMIGDNCSEGLGMMSDRPKDHEQAESDLIERVALVQKRAKDTGLVPDGSDDKDLMDAEWGVDTPERP
jgi:hypothetical protein